MIFKKKSGEHISDNSDPNIIPAGSTKDIKIYVCPVCMEDVSEKKYACASLREAQELKCINAGYDG